MRHIVALLGYAVLVVVAEPPTDPQQSGGAPASLYGAPHGGIPAPQYGAPAGGAPASLYGAPHGGTPAPQYGAPAGGARRPRPSSQYGAPNAGYEDDNGEPANYEFKYDVVDQQYGVQFGHQESRQGEAAQGEYYVLLPDGRTQHVVYTADEEGYHPKISYEGAGEGQGYGRGRPQGGYT